MTTVVEAIPLAMDAHGVYRVGGSRVTFDLLVRAFHRGATAEEIVQDVPQISGEDDPAMLAWATTNGRVVLTHDLSTMIRAMREQLRSASLCAPIVLVPDSRPIGQVIERLLLLDACAVETDWAPGVI